jgi:hypothetical protein
MRKVDLSLWHLSFWVLLPIFFSGCTREWNLSISSVVGGEPEFCFSQHGTCRDEGVQFVSIQIDEVDEHGQPVKIAWSIQGKSNQTNDFVIKRLIYGSLPPGWVQTSEPTPLRRGVYYSVMGQFYFVLSASDDVRIYPREEFFKKIARR